MIKEKRKTIKRVITIIACVAFISSTNVNAQENKNMITNNNDVKVTEKELDFINNFYGKKYFENMSKEDYEWIAELDINNRDIEIESTYFYENIPLTNGNGMGRGTTHTTASKQLSIARSCSSTCSVIVALTWLVDPKVKSYDLIGARLENTSLINNSITTSIKSNSGTTYSYDNRVLTNGFGTTVLLPNSSNIIIQQKFSTSLGGNIYASYQHATKSITKETSYKYTISQTGYGSVFLFNGDAAGIYDGMGGVNI